MTVPMNSVQKAAKHLLPQKVLGSIEIYHLAIVIPEETNVRMYTVPPTKIARGHLRRHLMR
jgi:hypothetical protein